MFFELSCEPLLFPRTILTAIAAIPPVDITLPAISAALAIHAGHMNFSFPFTADRGLLIALSHGLCSQQSEINHQK
jgi:hypothetical protein